MPFGMNTTNQTVNEPNSGKRDERAYRRLTGHANEARFNGTAGRRQGSSVGDLANLRGCTTSTAKFVEVEPRSPLLQLKGDLVALTTRPSEWRVEVAAGVQLEFIEGHIYKAATKRG